jgi:DNA-binding response OmpR family regulator
MRVAILEDEITLAKEVQSYLEQDGHSVKIFTDGESLVRVLRREIFDLFVLDWHVPKINGYQVLTHMRKTLSMSEPIIFLTSADAEDDVVSTLSAGADDYCIKPIRPREFLARIHSVDRRLNKRQSMPAEMKVIFGYAFNPVNHVISFDGRDVVLTEKEFNLALLFSGINQPFSRHRILSEVWGTSGDELSRTLDVHIAWIRKKLYIGAHGGALRLTAVYGYGYRLMQTFTDD